MTGKARFFVLLILCGAALFALWLSLPRPVNQEQLLIGGAVLMTSAVLGLLAAERFGKGAPLLAGMVGGGQFSRSDFLQLIRYLALGAIAGGLLLTSGRIVRQRRERAPFGFKCASFHTFD